MTNYPYRVLEVEGSRDLDLQETVRSMGRVRPDSSWFQSSRNMPQPPFTPVIQLSLPDCKASKGLSPDPLASQPQRTVKTLKKDRYMISIQ